ncbi:MAG: serine/threonine-protein phosphatase [Leptospiraceae bacterium]|nr:serine/threonine-protein phosphatase [Leptospiraceae bacterium]MCP5497701.1 serine/threonine-protein phosphatase [Leptospiraceae bacterium]
MIQNSKIKNILKLLNINQENLSLEEDLKIAKNVQESLFPKTSTIKGLKYSDFRKSHSQIGGDFYDFIRLREGNVGIFITDVSGHGISSAMVAAIIKVMVSTMPYSMKLHPSSFLDYLDEKLLSDFQSHHASAIYIYVDILKRSISIANAGHPYLVYASKNEPFQEIVTDGVILGFGIRKPVSNVINFTYHSGDRIFLYTDGLVESYNPQGEQLNSEGLLEMLNKHKEEADIGILKEQIIFELNEFYGKNDFIDDAMFLIFELE